VRALVLAGATLAAAMGCSAQSLDLYVPTRNVDLLFVVDDSSGTRPLQQNLLRNFPTLMATLQSTPSGPDVHIAVVSSDLGAGDGSIAGCDAAGGKRGVFQYAPRGSCTTSGLDPGATFISDVGGVRNYTGALPDVFSCIAPLGESGCGFEHPLAAAARALGADGSPPPPENAGFLRPGAFLFIVVVTNEDDCSAPTGSPLFDTKVNTTIDSTYGPISNFRCNEFGHLCNGNRPPRLAPNGSSTDNVALGGCVSAEETGMLTPLSTIAAQIRSLKAYPETQVLVGAIAGPKDPYRVRWSNGATGGLQPNVAPSCMIADTTSATPAVRLAQWVQMFGGNGIFQSVCSDNYAPSFQRIADLLAASPTPPPVDTQPW
jgi:hypothetical protein